MPQNQNNNNNNNDTPSTPEETHEACQCASYENTNWPFFTIVCDPNNKQDCCRLCNKQAGEFTYQCRQTTFMDQLMYRVPAHYCSASLGRKVMV